MDVVIYDSNGNLLKTLYQWDLNQTITVRGISTTNAPAFHFCNRSSTEALVVSPTVSGEDLIVDVPNVLLQAGLPLIVYAYQVTDNDGYRTMIAFQIPVVPRAKPSDYEYEDNVEYISAVLLNSRLDELIHNLSGQSEAGIAPEVLDIRVGTDGYVYQTAGDAVRAISRRVDEVQEEIEEYIDTELVDGLYYDDNTSLLYLTANGEIVSDPVKIVSGGGGGGGSDAKLEATNTTGWTTKTINQGSQCELSLNWSSIENDQPTGNGTLTVLLNNIQKQAIDVAQGDISIDVSQFLTAGTNRIKLKITDVYENSKTFSFTITVISLRLTSNFDTSGIFNAGEAVGYTYTPVGAVEKTVYFEVDGVTVGTAQVTQSGFQQSYMLPPMNHGAHSLRVWFTAEIDSDIVSSNELFYDLVVVDPESNDVIVASAFNTTSARQYEMLEVPYRIYTPGSLTSAVTLSVNGTEAAALTVDRSDQTWFYRAVTPGSVTLMITSGLVSKTLPLTISESEIDVHPVTDSLALYLNCIGRSNMEEHPEVWQDGERHISATLTNFNFVSDGWIADEDGVTVLRVLGDARVTIPFQPFANDFKATGKTIEIEFATHSVLDYGATTISCLSDGRGFQFTAQRAWIASEQSTIGTQYKEDEHVRISFVAEKRSENRLLYVYINGIMSGVVRYPVDDDFSQLSPVNISIGSNSATTDIYCIRVYNNNLTRHQIVNNWIADTQNIEDMIYRYEHNQVYDAYGTVVIENLPGDLPYLVLRAPVLPQYKGDKKDVDGYYVDPVDPSRSFSFTAAQADVQGTSSQYYARKNYKIKFKNGFIMTRTGSTSPTFQMRNTSIPTNTFTFKADVASSEGANNVELVRIYNETCPYKTPPQETDPRVRQGIDGFPIVVFWDNGVSTEFVGKYNFNNDKGTEEVFGFESGDESWETLQNSGDYALWKSDDYTGNAWQSDFEGRYPDGNTNPASLAALAAWMVTTDQTKATGEPLEESYTDVDGTVHTVDNAAYRLAKFRTEAPQHFEMQSLLYYYIFTELFLMVDSRVKNSFPSFLGGDKWCFLPYDMDTAIGIDNQGALVFGYNLEDIDYIGTEPVYNGQTSVLWNNVREAFPNEIKSMYQTLRSSGGISYDVIERMFEEHQSKWPEAIFNEDAWYKYIQPLVDEGNSNYLSMALGSKEEQRKWWLYNRFKYLDSKYVAGDAAQEVISLRPGAIDTGISITPYADIYATIAWDATIDQERTARGETAFIACPYSTVGNNVISIYNASQIASVGDLSGFKCRSANFAAATRLQFIKVGDNAAGYENPNLLELGIGNNDLLTSVDARNCTALTGSIEMSGARNIEEVLFGGTAISGVSLPVGGVLRTLQLPATVTNLTVRNQPNLNSFYMPSFANITTLRIENSGDVIPIANIIASIAANSRVRIIGLDLIVSTMAEVDTLYAKLDTMRGLDESGNNLEHAVVSGKITGLTGVSPTWLAAKRAQYPNVEIEYEYFVSTLNYYNYDGTQLLHTESVSPGEDGTWDGAPTREADAQYTYAFAGWALTTDASVADPNATKNVTTDRNVYAAYTRFVKTYTVTWKNDNGNVLETDLGVTYGTTPTYNGSTPSSALHSGWDFVGWTPAVGPITGDTIYTATYVQMFMARFYNGSTLLQTLAKVPAGTTPEYTGATPTSPEEGFVFDGWSPALGPISANTDYYAQFRDTNTPLRQYLAGTIREYSSSSVSKIAQYAFYNRTQLTSVEVAATLIEGNAFYGCSALNVVDLTHPTAQVTIQASAFASLGAFAHLIIRSEVVASLASTNALNGTKIAKGFGAIYVPADLVDTYKSATNWSTYAAQIHPISAYPLTDFSTISDDWATILSNPDYATDYAIGDTKLVEINGVQLYMQIAAFDADTLASGGGTAGISWVSLGFLEKRQMNSTDTVTNGYPAMELADYVSGLLTSLPQALQSGICEVSKTYRVKNPSDTTSTMTCKLWIPSSREVGFTNAQSMESSGPAYTTLFASQYKRIKYNAADTADEWWLRSMSYSDGINHVNTNGNEGAKHPNTYCYVVLGFCTNANL